MGEPGVLRGCPAREGAPSGAASRAALTVFVMKGELQRVLQQGPEHAVGRRDKGGVQGKRSGHFLHRDALNFFFLKKKNKKTPTSPQNVAELFPPSFAKSTSFQGGGDKRRKRKKNYLCLYKYICIKT